MKSRLSLIFTMLLLISACGETRVSRNQVGAGSANDPSADDFDGQPDDGDSNQGSLSKVWNAIDRISESLTDVISRLLTQEKRTGLMYLGMCTPTYAESSGENIINTCRCPKGTTVMILSFMTIYDRSGAKASGVSQCGVRNQNTLDVFGEARADAHAGTDRNTYCGFTCFGSNGKVDLGDRAFPTGS